MIKTIVGKLARAVKAVIYGPEGIGKSTLASQAPEPLFIDLEDGTAQLDIARVSTPKNWIELLSIIKEIASTPGICKTLVIDTADKAEMFCTQYICMSHQVNGIEGIGYGKGYTYLAEEFSRLMDALDLVVSAGINVILLAHAKMRKMELPDEAGAFDRWELKLTKNVAPLIKEWADAVLFLNFKTYVITTENGTKKGTGGKRVIYTSHSPVYDAKNRIGLQEEMELSYENIAPLFACAAKEHKPAKSEQSPLERLKHMISESAVTEDEVEKVVSENMPVLIGKQISEYDESFITEKLMPCWNNVVNAIKQDRTEITNQASEEPQK